MTMIYMKVNKIKRILILNISFLILIMFLSQPIISSGDITTNMTINVSDNLPPSFNNLINHTSIVDESFSYDLDASDNTEVGSFILNDTTYFNINISSGLITNSSNLSEIKVHWLEVDVNDTFGNSLTGMFYINITSLVPLIITGLPPSDMILGYDIYSEEYDMILGYDIYSKEYDEGDILLSYKK